MRNKRAMFFTIIVLFILTLFFMSYTIYDLVVDRSAVNKRIDTLNNFVFSVEYDIPRYLYVAGFRSVFLIHEEMVASGNYIDNFNDSFQELFYNGTLNDVSKDLMVGARYVDMKDAFEYSSLKINSNIDFSSPSVSVDQTDPWNIRILFTVDVFIQDSGGLVSWNRTVTVESFVPIEGFEDPLYLIETGQVTNSIYKSPYDFSDSFDLTNFTDHVENSYYYASDSAPSFIDRFEGNNVANENGIESFVYLPKLTAQGLSTSDKSVVDYIYFSSSNPYHYSVTGMPSWFGIDNQSGHVEDYSLDGYIY